MEQSDLVLSWKDFAINAPNAFRQLWDDQDFADVTLVTVDELQVKAHKVILSSVSPFFKNILQKNPHQNPLIYLKDINHKELDRIIRFVYLGQCEVEMEQLENFLVIGKALGVRGLKEEALAADIDIKEDDTLPVGKLQGIPALDLIETQNINQNITTPDKTDLKFLPGT